MKHLQAAALILYGLILLGVFIGQLLLLVGLTGASFLAAIAMSDAVLIMSVILFAMQKRTRYWRWPLLMALCIQVWFFHAAMAPTITAFGLGLCFVLPPLLMGYVVATYNEPV